MRRSGIRDVVVVLMVSWLVRLVFVLVVGDAHSLDVDHWRVVLDARAEGRNPYETGWLNWPPLWLEIIVVLDAIATHIGVSFLSALRVYLVLVESAIVVTLYVTLVLAGAERTAVRRALLVGIALNPVMVILVCQHGNSDVNVGLFVTLACAALIAHERSRDVVAWLAGCLLLGLGVLAKTTPLVLAPLLVPGARLATHAGRFLGAALFLLPVGFGLGVLLALDPGPIYAYVIKYQTAPGYFGFPGVVQQTTASSAVSRFVVIAALVAVAIGLWLWRRSQQPPSATTSTLLAMVLCMLGALGLVELLEAASVGARARYSEAFTIAVTAAVIWLSVRLWREAPLHPGTLFLFVAVIYMIVNSFGRGYAAHYVPWFLPALVATYVLLDDGWRRLLLAAYAIAAVTYVIEYATVPFLGSFASGVFHDANWITDVNDWLNVPDHWALLRLPLATVYVVVIAAGIARLRNLMTQNSGGSGARTSPPEALPAATAATRSR